MSREEYRPNVSSSQAGASSQNNSGANAFSSFQANANTFEDTSRPVSYLCGDCDAKVNLKKGDPIRCKECGYRILYKERTNRMIQFEAR